MEDADPVRLRDRCRAFFGSLSGMLPSGGLDRFLEREFGSMK